ncbi:hypothetical protein HPK19_04640 [Arthrobacter citreus]|nr:hypothetical protein HPK19_04640 [Arthrobacter citreus]
MKKVTVEYKFKNEIGDDYTNIGILFPNNKVLVADENGAVEIYNAYQHPTKHPEYVYVDSDNDSKDLTADSPEFIINLILSGGM